MVSVHGFRGKHGAVWWRARRTRTNTRCAAGWIFAATLTAGLPAHGLGQGRDVAIDTPDGLELRATEYRTAGGRAAVLLLHQCDLDRGSLNGLALRLQASDVGALAIDFRGYGDSRTEEMNDLSNADYWRLWERYPEDVNVAVGFLLAGYGSGTPLGVLGVSCGGAQAVFLSIRDPRVRALVVISSSLPRVTTEQIESLGERALPTLGIAATEDGRRPELTRSVVDASRHPESRMCLLGGRAHGTPLFREHPGVEEEIVDWVARVLIEDSSGTPALERPGTGVCASACE